MALFFGGIAVGFSAGFIYKKWRKRKKDQKRRTVEVHGEEFLLSKGHSTIVRLQKPKKMEVPISVGGKIQGRFVSDTKLVLYDVEAYDAIDKAWDEYSESEYVVMDYLEAENGKFNSSDWEKRAMRGIFD